MGLIYAYEALIKIVGAYDNKGISYEDILKVNNKSFRAKIERHWHRLAPNSETFFVKIEERNGLFFLTQEFKEHNRKNIPKWKSLLEEMLNKT